MNNPLKCTFDNEGHAAQDRNPGLGYNTLLFRLIRDLLSACPHKQFYTLPTSNLRAALSNWYSNACVSSKMAVLTFFIMVFGMTQPGTNPQPTV